MNTQFNHETATAAGSKPKQGRYRDYRNALLLQDRMIEIVNDREIKAAERATSARVWVDLYWARRVMLGLGDPKSVPAANDPSLEKPKRKRGQASTSEPATPDGPA